jgi:hypothetical protein
MIVHSDTEEDEDHHTVKPESEALSGFNSGPMTRTRKARDAQLRLGVGPPPVAGGRGPRIVTRSVGVAKGARSRSGRGAKPVRTPIVEGSSGFYLFRLPLILSDQLSVPCAGLCLYVSSLTKIPELQPTDTPEEAPLPPSNPATPQPRTTENGRKHQASTTDNSADQAGVRAIVEEQVCIALSSSLIPQLSVGTAPTAHGCITAETTPATGISPCSRSYCTKRQGYDSYE